MPEPSPQLVRNAQMGDTQALVSLVEGQQTYVYSIAMSLMHNAADAADMTQDAFIRLLRSLHTYRGETKFTTWLYRLVTNICLDGLRRRGRPVDSLDLPAGASNVPTPGERLVDADLRGQPEAAAELHESAAEVRSALGALPPPQRLALTLFYLEDLRYEEVAEVMGVPLNTVKSHIRRGKERMSMLLRASGSSERGQPCSATT